MSPHPTTSPVRLTPSRLAEIEADHARHTTALVNAGSLAAPMQAQFSKQIHDLLADRVAREQEVADGLRGLLHTAKSKVVGFTAAELNQNAAIHALATRLGLDLSSPSKK